MTRGIKMNIGLNFGAMAEPLLTQILAQGFVVRNKEKLEHLQLDADALARLSIRGVLTDSAADAARRKLIKMVCSVCSMNQVSEEVKTT